MNCIELSLFKKLYSIERRIQSEYYGAKLEQEVKDYFSTIKREQPEIWKKYEHEYKSNIVTS